MRKRLTLALLLAVPTIALAQGHEHGGGGGHPGGAGGGGPHMGGGGAPHMGGGGAPHMGGGGGMPHMGGGAPHMGGGEHRGPPPGAGAGFGGGERHGGGNHFDGGRPGGFDRPGGGDHHGGPGFASRNPGGFNDPQRALADRGGAGFRGGRGLPPPPSAGGWHRGWYGGHVSGFRPIRAGAYRYPNGWGYRRWGIGLVLPSILFGSAYYYSSWDSFGAYPPPPGDRWVRYGPDLLLVNIRTGRVDDAIYGAFY